MKKYLITLLLFSGSLLSQAAGYEAAMQQALEKLQGAKTSADFVSVSGQFEQIGRVKTDSWLPTYYAAYSLILASFTEKSEDLRDVYADKAIALTEKALMANQAESELTTLLGYAYQAKLAISPMSRGMSYGGKVNETLEKAIAQQPENPRPYHLLGQNLLFTPAMFGGGAGKACPYLKQAAGKFAKFEALSPLHPVWGNERNTKLLEKCPD